MGDIFIKNARVIDPVSGIDDISDILVLDGKIEKIGKDLLLPENMKIVDATDKWASPGLIDIHTHLRDPGYEYKEDIESGSKAAAAGGFTSILCMANTDPVVDNGKIVRYIVDKAKKKALINIYPVGALTKKLRGEEIADIADMKENGIKALSDDGRSVQNIAMMKRALEYSKMFDLLVMEHAESYDFAKGSMHEGAVSSRLGLVGIPRISEDIMVSRAVMLSEDLDVRIHISHISSKRSVRIVREAKKRGIKISAEVAPHHFSLTDEAVIGYKTDAKMSPPLRDRSDIDEIEKALSDGIIDAIASDHAPHASFEKDLEFEKAPFGIIGLESSLPLSLELVRKNLITASRLVELMSSSPARLVGLERGSLRKGDIADITLIDPEKEELFEADRLVSRSKNSPFIGMRLKGFATMTIVAGDIVYERS